MKSIQKGYPFDGAKTLELFPNRLNPTLVNERVQITIDPKIFPTYYTENQDLSDFLLARVFDYHKALEVAEQQIKDMQEEFPFLPEDFGFTPDKLPVEGSDYQRTFYIKGTNILTRDGDDKWILGIFGASPVKLSIANSHEAYVVFKSLGVISDEEFGEEVFSFTKEMLEQGEVSDQGSSPELQAQ